MNIKYLEAVETASKILAFVNLCKVKLITIYDKLYLQQQEVPLMADFGFVDQQSRPTEFLDFTSLTLEEFHQLVPLFEAAFVGGHKVWQHKI